jgi:hypothetical protein
MSTDTVASKRQHADCFEAAHRALEMPIYDLFRLVRAAEHLQEEGDDDLCSSACLIVELAAQKAHELNEQYQKSFPGEGIDSLRELDACERQLRETRTQAEALSKEDA